MKIINEKFIAKENIGKNPVRSLSLILIVSIFVTFLFSGSLISFGLTNGIKSLSNRLGADIIIVPQGYKANIESVLLKGEPSEFYLPDGTLEKIRNIDGVEEITPQLYVATLSADCCSYPVQIVGIDFETDFLIKSWLQSSLGRNLKDGEVIVGSHISGEKNDKIKFFNEDLNIVGKLEQTGMGFDATVFVNMNTANKLAKASERIQKNGASVGNKISTILIKINPNYNSVEVANEIIEKHGGEGIFAMFSKKFVNDISSNLKFISTYMYIIILIIWFISVVLLAFIFSMIVNERKREFGILRVIGASKKYLSKIIILESFYIGLYGSLVGIIFSSVLIFGIMPVIKNSLNVPFLIPSFIDIIIIGLISILIGIFIGMISSLNSIRKIYKSDSFSIIRENY